MRNTENNDLTALANHYRWPTPSAGLKAKIISAGQTPSIHQESFWVRVSDVFSFNWEPALAMAFVLFLGLGVGHLNTYKDTQSIQYGSLYQGTNFYLAQSIVDSAKGDVK